jgi:uncharacterized protein YutE (UPF0331/DUF86 family)
MGKVALRNIIVVRVVVVDIEKSRSTLLETVSSILHFVREYFEV